MSDWKYWEGKDFPKHKNCCDPIGGPDSDPDHCVSRCEEIETYLVNKCESLRAQLKTALERIKELEGKLYG